MSGSTDGWLRLSPEFINPAWSETDGLLRPDGPDLEEGGVTYIDVAGGVVVAPAEASARAMPTFLLAPHGIESDADGGGTHQVLVNMLGGVESRALADDTGTTVLVSKQGGGRSFGLGGATKLVALGQTGGAIIGARGGGSVDRGFRLAGGAVASAIGGGAWAAVWAAVGGARARAEGGGARVVGFVAVGGGRVLARGGALRHVDVVLAGGATLEAVGGGLRTTGRVLAGGAEAGLSGGGERRVGLYATGGGVAEAVGGGIFAGIVVPVIVGPVTAYVVLAATSTDMQGPFTSAAPDASATDTLVLLPSTTAYVVQARTDADVDGADADALVRVPVTTAL